MKRQNHEYNIRTSESRYIWNGLTTFAIGLAIGMLDHGQMAFAGYKGLVVNQLDGER